MNYPPSSRSSSRYFGKWKHGAPEYIEAKRLLAFLEWFLPIDARGNPENSIVREFIGGSILKDFTIWKHK